MVGKPLWCYMIRAGIDLITVWSDQAHLDLHRPEDYCQPFIVKRDPVVGRWFQKSDRFFFYKFVSSARLTLKTFRARFLILVHCARYTVASRDIPACQLILREAPVVHGPYTKTTPVCLSCYAKVRELIGFVYKLRSGGMGCFPKWFQYRKGVCLWETQKVIKQLNVSFIICSHIGVVNNIFFFSNAKYIWSGLDPLVL